MNYNDLTDVEIATRVATALGYENALGQDVQRGKPVTLINTGDGWEIFDPCHSWYDAGPIIQNHRISLLPSAADDVWFADLGMDTTRGQHETFHANPLRAAMIVLLMMQGVDE